MNESGLMTAKEVAARLGISISGFHANRAQWRALFAVSRPLGMRRYSRQLVERYCAGQSMTKLGKGARKAWA